MRLLLDLISRQTEDEVIFTNYSSCSDVELPLNLGQPASFVLYPFSSYPECNFRIRHVIGGKFSHFGLILWRVSQLVECTEIEFIDTFLKPFELRGILQIRILNGLIARNKISSGA